VHDDARAVDDRLNARPADVEEHSPDARHHGIELGDGFLGPENLELPPDHVEHDWAR
jgi:hypothetical protein